MMDYFLQDAIVLVRIHFIFQLTQKQTSHNVL